jgi:hypothetical protein
VPHLHVISCAVTQHNEGAARVTLTRICSNGSGSDNNNNNNSGGSSRLEVTVQTASAMFENVAAGALTWLELRLRTTDASHYITLHMHLLHALHCQCNVAAPHTKRTQFTLCSFNPIQS